MSSILLAGVDVGTTKTTAVIAELNGDPRLRVKVLGIGQSKSAGLRRVVTNIEETTEAVKAALQEAEVMAGHNVSRVYVAIGGDHIQACQSLGVVRVGNDEISRQDLERVHDVARAVALPPDRELLHALPQQYIVDHQQGIKDPVGMAATRLETEVLVVTCAATAAENIRKAVQRAGYCVQELVLEPLSSSRAVLTEDEKEVGVAMIEMGAGTTDVTAYLDGEIMYTAVFPIGGETVTNDLVRGLSVPFVEACRAKEQFGIACAQMVDPQETVELPGPSPNQKRHVARELIAHIIEQRMDELFGLIHADLLKKDLLDRLGAGIVLTGGAATLRGTLELAQQVFAAPVRYGVPEEGIYGLSEALRRPRFATAAGLVLYGADRYRETGKGGSTIGSGALSRAAAWLKEFF